MIKKSFRIEEEEYKKVIELCKKFKVSFSDYVRETIINNLNDRKCEEYYSRGEEYF
jgi:hypothetical protein